MSRKKISIAEFLTVDEVVTAIKMYKEASEGTFARKCAEEIITPVLPRINKKLRQDNHPLFLAYMVEYTFMQMGVKERINQVYERN